MTNKARLFVLLSGAILLFATQQLVSAGPPFLFRHGRAINRGCICKTPYDDYENLDLVSADSIMLRASSTPDGPVDPLDNGGGNDREPKWFFGDTTQVQTGGLTLDRIGAKISQTGEMELTGQLAFDGGPNNALHGAHAVLRVRLLSGTAGQAGELFGATLITETAQRIWVSKDDPQMVSLLPLSPSRQWQNANSHVIVHSLAPTDYVTIGPANFAEAVRAKLSRVTHIQLVLERRNAK